MIVSVSSAAKFRASLSSQSAETRQSLSVKTRTSPLAFLTPRFRQWAGPRFCGIRISLQFNASAISVVRSLELSSIMMISKECG